MPGHNHRSWCVCGWCRKDGAFSPADRVQLEAGFKRWSADRKLRGEGVTRSYGACFVAPNATCPVCHERVFFYSNARGSRVFFDDLGWPWPKHPCTDRAAGRRFPSSVCAPLLVRKPAALQEIAAAVKDAGLVPRDEFHRRHGAAPWDTFMVVAVERAGFLNTVEAAPLVPPGMGACFFQFTSEKVIPEPEQPFSFKDNRISILDQTSQPRIFKARSLGSARPATRIPALQSRKSAT